MDNQMRVLVIGAHGKIGRRLVPILVEEGHDVVAMVRSPDQEADMSSLGAEPVIGDLEEDFEQHLEGIDAVVFAAGSGGGTGAAKTVLVDGLGAIRAVDAARKHGARRFVIVSSLGADDPDRSESIRAYLVAKAIADGYLQRSGLDYTVVRPGRLTDDEPTESVRVGDDVGSGSISRGDVALVLARCLRDPATIGKTFEVVDGKTAVVEALRAF